MDRALWLLLWLRFRGWFRRLGRNTRSVRGVLLLVLGVVFFGCVFLNPIISYFVGAVPTSRTHSPEYAQRYGPLGLFAYCAMTLLFSTGERAITFTPAEINFLFPGPFYRRQLLAYKIAASVLGCLVTGLFMSVVALSWGTWPLAAYVGTVVTLLFLFLFGLVIALAANALGARAFSRRRQVVLAGLLLLVVFALLPLGRDLVHLRSPRELLEQVEQSAVLQAVLAPLGWFVHAFWAQDLRELAVYAAACLGVDAALVVVVFLLDADYLEASASASERVYARIQRIRQAGPSSAWYTPGTGRRITLPALPYWGGVGPVAWRQMLAALRSLRGLTIFLVFLGGALLVVPVIVLFGGERPDQPEVSQILAFALVALSVISLPATLTFDFRGDVDRMDVLKALPVAPWRVAVGQLVGVVLLLGVIQLLGLLAIQAAFGGVQDWLLGAVFLCWPADFLTLGLDNLLFLWFPTRQVVVQPGDFQMMGRQMLLLLTKFAVLGVALAGAGLAGALTWWLAGHSLLAGVLAATVVLLGAAAGLVPLLALAFDHFDVARDTPA